MSLQQRLNELDRRTLGPSEQTASDRPHARSAAFVAWLGLVVAMLLVAGAAGGTHDPRLFIAWVLLAPAMSVTFSVWRRS